MDTTNDFWPFVIVDSTKSSLGYSQTLAGLLCRRLADAVPSIDHNDFSNNDREGATLVSL